MSTSSIAAEAREDVPVSPPDLSQELGNLIEELLTYGAAKLSRQVGEWLRDLERTMASRGPFERAAYEAGKAHLQGKNPVWAGAKGAWSGATVPQRVAAVVILVLLLLLAPVALVLLILGILIAALVAGIRAARR
ncbi:hypothetical protein [Nonomuraea dietziae]|uniref:hypothetical protein n=1 Tax=Nonomuraea dietziae TaxID=65515 RepID=UPI00343AB35B